MQSIHSLRLRHGRAKVPTTTRTGQGARAPVTRERGCAALLVAPSARARFPTAAAAATWQGKGCVRKGITDELVDMAESAAGAQPCGGMESCMHGIPERVALLYFNDLKIRPAECEICKGGMILGH